MYKLSLQRVTAEKQQREKCTVRNLFGELQMSSLADYIQASLMLNYNKREVG